MVSKPSAIWMQTTTKGDGMQVTTRVSGTKFLADFQQSEKKVFEIDLRVKYDLTLDQVRDALVWLFEQGYIGHNDNVRGWDKKTVTNKGCDFLGACGMPTSTNAA